MTRLFIGIKCNGQKYLAEIQTEVKQLLRKSKITWVEPANFHITLKFLGDVEQYSINSIARTLDAISKNYYPPGLVPDRVGIFGHKHQPRVIWFGYQDNHLLSDIQSAIDTRFSELGFEAEQKKFKPHLTFGRMKSIIEQKELDDYLMNQPRRDYDEFVVDSFYLFKSILRKEGPEYQVLQEFRLKCQETGFICPSL